MVVGLVLELEEPFLGLSVNIDIHIDAASVVLLALLKVIEHSVGAEPAGTDGCEIHQAEGLLAASEVGAHLIPETEALTDFRCYE